MIGFTFDIVGGEHDGVELPSPAWLDDGDTPCPDVIFVGVCEGARCGSSVCRAKRSKFVHVGYWLAEEKSRPAGAVRYRKQDEHVLRDPDTDSLHGRAVYAIGGLLAPGNFGAKAREPVTA